MSLLSRRGRSTRTRLLLLVLLVAMPAFLVQGFGAWYDLQQNIAARNHEAGQLAVRARGKFETLLETSRSVFIELVRMNVMRNPDNCTLVFNNLRISFERLAPDATNLGFSDAAGDIYCAVNPVLGNGNIADQLHFIRATRSLEMAAGDYEMNPTTGLPTLSIAYPILSFDGKVLTVIFITYELRWLENWQKEVALPAGAALTLIAPDGKILQRYVDGATKPITGSAAQTQWFTPLKSGQVGLQTPDLDGITRLNTLAPLRLGSQTAAWLHLGYPVNEIYTQARQALAWRLTLLGIIFILALGLAWWGSESLFLKPLNSLMRVVVKVQQGDLSARAASIPAVGELTGLALAFDRMTESLQQRENARQAAQTEFEQSEARFHAMFINSAVGIGMMDLDRKVIDANPAMCKMLGRSLDELVGQTPATVTHPDDLQNSTQEYQDLLAGKVDHYITERRYVRKNGEVFWASVSMNMVRDAKGTPLYLVGLITDIDLQRRAIEDLRESEARFRAMFENAGIGIALVGLDRRALAVNDNMVRMSGFSREDLLNANGFDLSYPPDKDMGQAEFARLVSGKLNSYQVERRYFRKDGQPYWVKQTISAVRGGDNKLLYLVAMVEDIEQQKQGQEDLRASEARFRAMFDNAAVGMSLMTLDRRVVSINQVAERIIGREFEELKGIDPSELSHPDDREIGAQQFREMVAGKRNGFTMEKRYIRKDGAMIWARVTYSMVADKEGKPQYLVGMIEDITKQKLADEKLAAQEAEYRRTLEQRVDERTHELAEANLRLQDEIEQRKRAEEALALKAAEDAVAAERTRLARDLHDAVTQTLFASSLIAEVLPDLWALDVDEAKKTTEELRQLTRGALAEMRTLLLELRPAALTQTRLGDLIRQLCDALIGRSRLPINLVVEGERSLPPEVQVAFYRIAQESLNNVFKYARATQVNVSLYITPAGSHLDICDNGIGFDMATVRPTSLGLRIMNERAGAVGALLSISSKPGKGVCVDLDWVEKPEMKLSVFRK